jgi:hypothetical protein
MEKGGTVEPIKLVTIGLPNLLEGLVSSAFDKRGNLEIIGHYRSLSQYLARDDEKPTVIVIESAGANECNEVMYSHPRAQLVSIENSGRKLYLWKMVPHMQNLGEVSLDELVDKILPDKN